MLCFPFENWSKASFIGNSVQGKNYGFLLILPRINPLICGQIEPLELQLCQGVQNLRYAVEESSVAAGSEEEAETLISGCDDMEVSQVIGLPGYLQIIQSLDHDNDFVVKQPW